MAADGGRTRRAARAWVGWPPAFYRAVGSECKGGVAIMCSSPREGSIEVPPGGTRCTRERAAGIYIVRDTCMTQ